MTSNVLIEKLNNTQSVSHTIPDRNGTFLSINCLSLISSRSFCCIFLIELLLESDVMVFINNYILIQKHCPFIGPLLLTAKPMIGRSLGAFTQKQLFGPRTAKSQPIGIKFCTHLLLYGLRPRSARGRLQTKPNDCFFCNTCNVP